MTSCNLVYTLLILDWTVFGYTERARSVRPHTGLVQPEPALRFTAVNVLSNIVIKISIIAR